MRVLSRAFPSTSSNVSTASPFIVDRRPPPDLGKWANFKRFIWNKEKRTFCNRTSTSWCKVICFYLIFLMLMLAVFFVLMLGATRYIRKNYKLPWIDKYSLMEGGSPGVGFIPNIIRQQSPLLWYTNSGTQSKTNMKYTPYVHFIHKTLKAYTDAERTKELYDDCNTSSDRSKPCFFDAKALGPCANASYGYPDKKPCIYIKINKQPGWVPEYYQGNDLPREMPYALKELIKQESNKKKLWIYCGGTHPHDEEHVGQIDYYPFPGMMGYYFPYSGDTNYLSPLVAVKVDHVKPGFLINIRCSAWAKNIPYEDVKTHGAFVQLYLAID